MRVLVVEDEASLARQLTAALRRAGYAVDHVADGERADLLGHDERYDAVVLDLGLPKVDGLTLLRRWREAGQAMPVLVLTARGSWHEKVQGIDSGADDYMAKPFRMEELLARLRALIRRSSGQSNPELRCGPLVLDPRSGKVILEGAEVKLTSHEFRVLSYLMHHSQRLVSQSELTEHIYSQGFDRDSNTVEVFIARLRRKLGPAFIETVRSLGYRMKAKSMKWLHSFRWRILLGTVLWTLGLIPLMHLLFLAVHGQLVSCLGCGHRNICCFFHFMHIGGDLAVPCRNVAFWPSASTTIGSARWFRHQNRRDISNRSAAIRE